LPHVEIVLGAVSRLAEHLGRLARLCSWAGFANFKKAKPWIAICKCALGQAGIYQRTILVPGWFRSN